MTNTISTHYVVCLLLAFMAVGISPASASEVTGTLSSSASSDQQTTGTLGGSVSSNGGTGLLTGTVTEDNTGGGGGSRSNRNNSGSSSNSPSGSVLGAQDSNTQSPGFPNAGTLTEASSTDQSLWSTVKAFFGNILSF